ncbi:serine hydrolase [uncultured Polaribacter sp.]|uniref:serine hydrolase n=1 Tax=uncultured Polaribacter sp. TaxID=174711 RepID=UPI0030DD1637|tara:strand:+ start:3089 stop:3991 length:903 start_codon:yes stop_codon:yes gene_type:complete
MKYIFTSILSLFTLFIVAQSTNQNIKTELPLQTNKKIKSISEIKDANLQSILEKKINANKTWRRLVKKKKMSIGIVDLSDTSNFRYAGINDNFMMYAASLPKIAILLASVDALEKKELEYTDDVKNDMRIMISKSNNSAATRMIDRLGFEKIENVLRDPKNKLYDEKTGGGLWVGKRYAAQGRRYPEPMKGISHAATTRQVCNFYYQMALGNLVNRERSKQMLDIMIKPELHHKLVNTLDKIAPDADVYRKSGSWRNFHSDSALVWGPNRKYIIVVLLQDDFGEQIIRNIVKPIEKVLNI